MVAALCLGLSSFATAASFTLNATGSTGGSASTGALNTASGSPCSLAGESLTCLSGTLSLTGLSGHFSFSATLAGLPAGSSWTLDPLNLSFTDPALPGGVSSVPTLGGPALALMALLLALTPVLRRRGVGKARWTLVQTVASGAALSLVFAIGPIDDLQAQPTPGSQTATATVGSAALRQLSLTLNANGTVSYTAYIRTGTPPVMGNVPDQSVTSGTAITPFNLASYASSTEGDTVTGYRIASGSLPSGLTLVGATLSGTPAASGSFSVQAQDRDGWSNADAVTITVNALPAIPAAPTGLALVSDTGTSSSDLLTHDGHASWATVSGATSYEVSLNGSSWTDIGNATSHDFSAALAQGANTLYVRAKNAGGVSASNATLAITYDSVAPASTGDGNDILNANQSGTGYIDFGEGIDLSSVVLSLETTLGQADGTVSNIQLVGNRITYSYTTANLTPVEAVIRWTAKDMAGNTGIGTTTPTDQI